MKKLVLLLMMFLMVFCVPAQARGDRWMYLDANARTERWFDTYTIENVGPTVDYPIIFVAFKTNFGKEYVEQTVADLMLDTEKYNNLSYRIDKVRFDPQEKLVWFLASEYFTDGDCSLGSVTVNTLPQQVKQGSTLEKDLLFIADYYLNKRD